MLPFIQKIIHKKIKFLQMRLIYLLALYVLTSSIASGLTLSQALDSAYNSNEKFELARNELIQSSEELPKALARFLPDITGTISYGNTRSKTLSDPQPSNQLVTTKHTNSESITLSQPIFRGWSSVAGMKAARASLSAAKAKYYFDEQKAILDAIEIYLTLYASKSKLKILESSVKLNQKQFEAASERLKLGEATRTDVASAKSSLSIAQSKYLRASAEYESASANFVNFFSMPAQEVVVPSIPENLPKDLVEFEQAAATQDFSIIFQKNQHVAAKAGLAVQKGGLLPQISLSLSATRTREGEGSAGAPRPLTKGVQTSSTLSMNIPIYSAGGTKYSEIRTARNQSRRQAVILDQTIKSNKSTSVALWKNFVASRSSIDAIAEAVDAAKLAYEGTKEEELLGSKSLIDVLTAEEKLSEAQIEQVNITKEYVSLGFQIKSHLGELTAKQLKLNVKYFNPDDQFKKAKIKIIGF